MHIYVAYQFTYICTYVHAYMNPFEHKIVSVNFASELSETKVNGKLIKTFLRKFRILYC